MTPEKVFDFCNEWNGVYFGDWLYSDEDGSLAFYCVCGEDRANWTLTRKQVWHMSDAMLLSIFRLALAVRDGEVWMSG